MKLLAWLRGWVVRRLTPEEWLGIVLITIMALFLLWALSACSALGKGQKGQSLHMVWSDGECVLVVAGLTAEQAGDLQQSWRFANCKVDIVENEKEVNR